MERAEEQGPSSVDDPERGLDLERIIDRRLRAAQRFLTERPGDEAGFLAALRSYLDAVGEVEPEEYDVDERRVAAGVCDVILDLCNTLAGRGDPPAKELASAVRDAVWFLGLAGLEPAEETARRLLDRFEAWIGEDPAAKIPVFGQGIADLLDGRALIVDAGAFARRLRSAHDPLLDRDLAAHLQEAIAAAELAEFDEVTDQIARHSHARPEIALLHSQRLLFGLEPFLHRSPPDLQMETAKAHLRHARLLTRLGSPLAPHHFDRAVSLAEAGHARTGRDIDVLLDILSSQAERLRTDGDGRMAGKIAERIVAVSEELGGRSALHNVPKVLDLLGSETGTAALIRAIASAEEAGVSSDFHRRALLKALDPLVERLYAAREYEAALPYSDRALGLWEHLHGDDLVPPERRTAALDHRTAILTALDRYADAVAPARLAVELYSRLCDVDPRHRGSLANALFNLQLCLDEVGEHAEAATSTARMIRLYTGLADEHPGELADAYRVHGGVLSGLRRHDEALAALRESVSRFEGLAEGDRDHYLPQLADTVTSLGVAMQRAGRPSHERLAVSERVVALEDELASFERVDARALAYRNHSIHLADAGRHEEAVAASARSVDIADQAGRGPKNLYLLAGCLDQHAARLRGSGRAEEALDFSLRSIEAHEELVAGDRARYLIHAGGAMTNHARTLADLGRPDESVDVLMRTVDMLDEAGAETADPKSLGNALGNLVADLIDADRSEEALEVSERALRVRGSLAEADPAARDGLAIALSQRGQVLHANGETEQALPYSERAVSMFFELVAEDGPHHRHHLLTALDLRVIQLADLGRFEEAAALSGRAAEVAEEAAGEGAPGAREHLVRVLGRAAEMNMEAGLRSVAGRFYRRCLDAARRLSEEDRDAHLRLLRDMLADAGWIWRDADPQAALAATAELVTLTEELSDPERNGYDLAFAVDVHACALAELGRFRDAVEVSDLALARWERRGEDPDIAWCLSHRGEWLVETGAADEAVEVSTRAIELYRRLHETDPELGDQLADALRRHAHVLHMSGRDPEAAIAAAREAVALHEDLAEARPLVYLPELALALITAARMDAGDPAELFARALAAYEQLEAADPGVFTTRAAEAATEAESYAKGWS